MCYSGQPGSDYLKKNFVLKKFQKFTIFYIVYFTLNYLIIKAICTYTKKLLIILSSSSAW